MSKDDRVRDVLRKHYEKADAKASPSRSSESKNAALVQKSLAAIEKKLQDISLQVKADAATSRSELREELLTITLRLDQEVKALKADHSSLRKEVVALRELATAPKATADAEARAKEALKDTEPSSPQSKNLEIPQSASSSSSKASPKEKEADSRPNPESDESEYEMARYEKADVNYPKPKPGKLSNLSNFFLKHEKNQKATKKEKAEIETAKERRLSTNSPPKDDGTPKSKIGNAMTIVRNTILRNSRQRPLDEKALEESPEKDQDEGSVIHHANDDDDNSEEAEASPPSPESQIPEARGSPQASDLEEEEEEDKETDVEEESTKEEMPEGTEWPASAEDSDDLDIDAVEAARNLEEFEMAEEVDEVDIAEEIEALRAVFDEAADQNGCVNRGSLSGAMAAASQGTRMRRRFTQHVQDMISKIPESHDTTWWEFRAECQRKLHRRRIVPVIYLCRCGPKAFGASRAAPYCQRCGVMVCLSQVPAEPDNSSLVDDIELSELAWPLLEGESQSSHSEQQCALKAVVQYLRSCPANFWNWQGPMSSPLQAAVRFGRADLVYCLLKEGASVNEKDEKGVSALHWAVFDGSEKMCKLLLDMNADVNVLDSLGQSPLFFAPKRDICRSLVERKADLACINRKGQSALHLAARGGIMEVYKYLDSIASSSLSQFRDAHGATARQYTQLGVKSRDMSPGQELRPQLRKSTSKPHIPAINMDSCSMASGGSSPSSEMCSSRRQWRQRHEQASREYQAFMSEAAVTDSGNTTQRSQRTDSIFEGAEDRAFGATPRRARESPDRLSPVSTVRQISRSPPPTPERTEFRRMALRAPQVKYAQDLSPRRSPRLSPTGTELTVSPRSQERFSAPTSPSLTSPRGVNAVPSRALPGSSQAPQASLGQSRSSQLTSRPKVIRGGGQRSQTTAVGDDALAGSDISSSEEFRAAGSPRALPVDYDPVWRPNQNSTGSTPARQTDLSPRMDMSPRIFSRSLAGSTPSRQSAQSPRVVSREEAAGSSQQVVAQQAAAQLATAAVATAMALEDAGHSQSTAGVLRQLRNSGIISSLPELGVQEALSAAEKRNSGIFDGDSMELELGRGDLAGGGPSRHLQPVQEDSGEGSEDWSDPERFDVGDMEPIDLEEAF